MSAPRPDTPPAAPSRPSFLRSAGIVGLMTLLSRVTGLFQSRLLAYVLGVGPAADAYFVAFRIPNLLRRFTAEGTMTAAFLPTVSETEARDGEAAARDMVASFLGSLAVFMLLLCTLGILCMGLFTGLQMIGRIAPGQPFTEQLGALARVLLGRRPAPADLALTTALARIMFPYLGLVSLTAGLSAVLNLRGRFGLPASVNTFWNLAYMGTALLALWLGPASWREPAPAAFVFAFAVLAGGVTQLAILWPSFRALGFGVKWGLNLRHPGVRKALARMAPGILGAGVHPINVVVSTVLASQLAAGAQSVLFQSNMMGEMVLGVFTASVATVSLPAMSRLVDAGDLEGLRDSLGTALRGTALLAIPASVGMAVLAAPIIGLIFQTGRFDAAATAWTARTLAYQAVGLIFVATSRIASQALYALKDYRTPALAALGGIGANIVLSWVLMRHLDTGGIALANGLSALLVLALQVRSLRRRMGRLPWRAVLGGWASMGLCAALMGGFAWWGGRLLGLARFHGTAGTAMRLLPLIAAASLVYFALLRVCRVPEAGQLMGVLRRKLGRR